MLLDTVKGRTVVTETSLEPWGQDLCWDSQQCTTAEVWQWKIWKMLSSHRPRHCLILSPCKPPFLNITLLPLAYQPGFLLPYPKASLVTPLHHTPASERQTRNPQICTASSMWPLNWSLLLIFATHQTLGSDLVLSPWWKGILQFILLQKVSFHIMSLFCGFPYEFTWRKFWRSRVDTKIPKLKRQLSPECK